MLKRWFAFTPNGNGSNGIGEDRNGCAVEALALMEPEAAEPPKETPAPAPQSEDRSAPVEDPLDFERIYRSAAVKPPQLPYGILKVVEMMNSHHLSSMPADARRAALLMALEAVGAEVEDLLQDAVVRQRALKDYEDEQQQALRRFEASKAEQNRALDAELDRLTAEYTARMQANLDEVAREQDKFRLWQKRKQHEAQQIADAAAFCVPEGLAPAGGGLAAVLERASAVRR